MSIPPLSTTYSLDFNLYWGIATFVAWSLFCALSGYLYGYLHRQPRYIILRDSDMGKIEAPPELIPPTRYTAADP